MIITNGYQVLAVLPDISEHLGLIGIEFFIIAVKSFHPRITAGTAEGIGQHEGEMGLPCSIRAAEQIKFSVVRLVQSLADALESGPMRLGWTIHGHTIVIFLRLFVGAF